MRYKANYFNNLAAVRGQEIPKGQETPKGPRVLRSLWLTAPFGTPPPRWWPHTPGVFFPNYQRTREALSEFRPHGALVFSLRRMGLGPLRALDRQGVATVYTLNDWHLEAFQPTPRPKLCELLAFPSGEGEPTGRLRKSCRFALERSLLKPATLASPPGCAMVAISRYLSRRLWERGCLDREVPVVPPGIPLPRFPTKVKPGHVEPPLRVIYAGRLHPEKGVHTAVEAVSSLRLQGVPVELTLAGKGTAEYERRLHQVSSPSKEAVRFLGWVDRGRIPALIRDHDLLVFPSIWPEPFGLSQLESMATGTPVVSTDRGGLAELILHDVNALRFEAGDADDLADKMARFLREPALGPRLAQEALKRVRTRYSIDSYVDGLLKNLPPVR